ncbi:Flp family type IVb pilin [Streptomyces sp. SLBN-118]|uniref:Flp family type IVb pilin n=1 Tax=Streptomyces sp. SLBN-118 TaxID=2768454 RepID=UPI00114F37AE|nr:hypothetical protein [Streptomyces sp. SLBN-118]
MSRLGLHTVTGVAHTGAPMAYTDDRGTGPSSLKAVRILLHVLFAFTVVGSLGVIGSAVADRAMTPLLFGLALYAAAPGVLSWVLLWRIPRGGRRVWRGLIALQTWLIAGSLLNLAAGSLLGLSQLLLPVLILAFLTKPESGTWFGAPVRTRNWRDLRAALCRFSLSRMLFRRGERGQTAVEYVGLIVVVTLIILTLATGGVSQSVANGLRNEIVCAVTESSCPGGGGAASGSGSGSGGTAHGGTDSGGTTGGADGGTDGGSSSGGTATGGASSGEANSGGAASGGSDSRGSTGGGDTSGSNGGADDGSTGGGSGSGGSGSGGSTGGDNGGTDGGNASGGISGGNSGGASGGSTSGGSSGGSSSGGGAGGSDGGSNSGGANGGSGGSSGGNNGGSNTGGSSGGSGGANGGSNSGSNSGGSHSGGSGGSDGGSNTGGANGGGSSGGAGGSSGGSSSGSSGGSGGSSGANGGSNSGGSHSGGSGGSDGGSNTGRANGGGSSGGAGGSSGANSSGSSGGSSGGTGGGLIGGLIGGTSSGGSGGSDGGSSGGSNGGSSGGTSAGSSSGGRPTAEPTQPDDPDREDPDDHEDRQQSPKNCDANGLNAGAFGSGGRVALAGGPGDGADDAGLEQAVSGLSAIADDLMATSSAVVSGFDTLQQAESAAGCSDATRQNTDHDEGSDANVGVGLEPNPHPEVAIDPKVDVEDIQDSIDGQGHVTWRESGEQLYRNDTRPPSVIFKEGFAPQDPNNPDLDSYVNESQHSAFVGTTNNEQFATKWGAKYVYDIDAPGGIDINKTFDDPPFSHEDEIAFPGGIRPEYIRGVWEVRPDGSLGKYTGNKNFKG